MRAGNRRLIVGISGASGSILGFRLLQALSPMDIETHLVLSQAARITISTELDREIDDFHALADVVYENHDIGEAIASGSFDVLGMVVVPCSIKTLSAVANSYTAAELYTYRYFDAFHHAYCD